MTRLWGLQNRMKMTKASVNMATRSFERIVLGVIMTAVFREVIITQSSK